MKIRIGPSVATLACLTLVLMPGASGAAVSQSSPGSSASFTLSGPSIGLNCSPVEGYGPQMCRAAGAGLARVEFWIGSTPASMERLVAEYASRGIKIQPLAGFHGRLPSVAEAESVRSWALRFGPKGTFWKGRKDRRLAFTYIELGNETSYIWQYGDTFDSASYRERARTYALRARDAGVALRGTGVGLLVQGDDADLGGTVWFDEMFGAVPDLAEYASGWTVHPYGPAGRARIDRTLAYIRARAATPPRIFVTEWGLASDDGRPLNDNYGYPTNMTYQQAAATLRDVVASWRSRFGKALVQVLIFQSADRGPSGSSSDRERFFGVVRNNSWDKGAYTAVARALMARTRLVLNPGGG